MNGRTDRIEGSGGLVRTENWVNGVWRLLVRLTLIGLGLYACYRLRSIIATIFIAAIIAYVLDPSVEWLCRFRPFVHLHEALTRLFTQMGSWYQRVILREEVSPTSRVHLHRHVIRLWASLYVFIGFFVVLWYGGKLIINPFIQEFKNATSETNRRQIGADVQRRLRAYDQTAPDWAKSDKLLAQLKTINLAGTAQKVAGEAGLKILEGAKNIVEVVVLPVLAFYFLIDGSKLKREFISLTPRPRLKEALFLTREFNRIMRAFVIGQVILCVLAGVVVGLGLWALGVRYPFVLGVLAGVTRAIPIVGPIIGGIPIILLTLATKGVPTALGVLGFFTFLHFAESKFIMPLLIGDRMELHPVVIIVVLIVGGEFGGLLVGGSLGSLLGMFFAAPVAAMARVMVRRYWLHTRHHLVSPEPGGHSLNGNTAVASMRSVEAVD